MGSPMKFMLTIMQVPPFRHQVVMALQHLVEFARQVGCVHHATPGTIRHFTQRAQHSGGALTKRAMRPIALQLVVFDEVDAGLGECACLRRCFRRAQADAWLQDRADEWSVVHAGQLACAMHPKLRLLVCIQKRGWQCEVQQAQTREGFQLREIARHGGQKVGQ